MPDSKHAALDTTTERTSSALSSVERIAQGDPDGKVADILFGPDRKDSLTPPGGEDPPPEFTPYEADYEMSDDGDVVSHDPHLNEDGTSHIAPYTYFHRSSLSLTEGEALYRFLLSHAQQPPVYVLRMSGTHTEVRTRRVQRTDSDGHTHWHTETYTETVLDFIFAVDLAQYVVAGPVHWSVPDEVPTYRGEMVKEVHAQMVVEQEGMGQERQTRGKKGKDMDLESGIVGGWMRRTAEDAEVEAAETWERTRIAKGFPPWVVRDTSSDAIENTRVLKSSKTVREWADEYCGSNKVLKEFVFEKVR